MDNKSQDSNSGRQNCNHAMCNLKIGQLQCSTETSSTKPSQMIQNAAVCLLFSQPKRTCVTPLLIRLHWLPVVVRIKFEVLMLVSGLPLKGHLPTPIHSQKFTIHPTSSGHGINDTLLFLHNEAKVTLQNLYPLCSSLVE